MTARKNTCRELGEKTFQTLKRIDARDTERGEKGDNNITAQQVNNNSEKDKRKEQNDGG